MNSDELLNTTVFLDDEEGDLMQHEKMMSKKSVLEVIDLIEDEAGDNFHVGELHAEKNKQTKSCIQVDIDLTIEDENSGDIFNIRKPDVEKMQKETILGEQKIGTKRNLSLEISKKSKEFQAKNGKPKVEQKSAIFEELKEDEIESDIEEYDDDPLPIALLTMLDNFGILYIRDCEVKVNKCTILDEKSLVSSSSSSTTPIVINYPKHWRLNSSRNIEKLFAINPKGAKTKKPSPEFQKPEHILFQLSRTGEEFKEVEALFMRKLIF